MDKLQKRSLYEDVDNSTEEVPMATGDVVKTQRADRYHVEIRHPGRDWTHIHGTRWETTMSLATVRRYASLVEADHPGSEVRIIKTRATEVTRLASGETTTVDLGTEVVDR